VALFLIILLVIAAGLGILGTILKVAVGVALGLVLGVAAIAWLVTWRVRRALRGPRQRRIPGSRVEVLDRRPRP
jgi:heme A synthase